MTDDVIELHVAGKKFSTWMDVTVSRGIERMPGSFNFTCTEHDPTSAMFQIRVGMPCEVWVNGVKIITGYITDYDCAYAPGSTVVSIGGVSQTAKLVTSSAYVATNQIQVTDVVDLAKKVCAPISVSVVNRSQRTFPKLTFVVVNPGQQPFELLDNYTKMSGSLIMDSATGDLVIADVGSTRASGTLMQGVNLESLACRITSSGRYSHYTVLHTAADNLGDIAPGTNVCGKAQDPMPDELPGFLPLVLIAPPNNGNLKLPQDYADFVATRNWGRSRTVTVKVSGWRDASGTNWEPNTLVTINAPIVKQINQELLISDVVYTRGANGVGTSAILTLMPKEAFVINPTGIYIKNIDFYTPDTTQTTQDNTQNV